MKNYKVTRIDVSDEPIYFIGQDYTVTKNKFICHRLKGMFDLSEEENKKITEALDFAIQNDLKISV